MNVAWYGHLKFKDKPIVFAILGSWAIAFFEYCLMVPANRLGADSFSVTQLKVTQEVLSLVTFAVVSAVLFGDRLRWNHFVSFALIVLACWFAFRQW